MSNEPVPATPLPVCTCGHEFSETQMFHLGECPRRKLPPPAALPVQPNAEPAGARTPDSPHPAIWVHAPSVHIAHAHDAGARARCGVYSEEWRTATTDLRRCRRCIRIEAKWSDHA